MAGPATSPRSFHPLRFGRNPLHRRSDLLRRVLTSALLLGIGASMVLGALIGMLRYDVGRAAAARATAGLSRATATTVDASAPYLLGNYGGTALTEVTWSVAGVTHRGTAPVDRNTATGSPVTIWLDAKGNPVAGPAPAATTASAAAAMGLCVAAGGTLLVSMGYLLSVARLDRAAMKAWEREWAEVGPVWARQS